MNSSVHIENVYADNPFDLETKIEALRVAKVKQSLNMNQRFEVTNIKRLMSVGDCEAEVTYTLRWD